MKPVSFLPPTLTVRTKKQNYTIFKTKENELSLKLASKIKLLPSVPLELAYTDDLKQSWKDLRLKSISLASLFLCKSFNWNISDFENNLNACDKKAYKLLDSVAERYLSIYKLIKYTYPKIKKKIVACPSSPEELFFSIIEWDINKSFELLIENDYLEFNSNQFNICAKKTLQMNKSEMVSVRKLRQYRENIPKYLKNRNRNPWSELLAKINSIDDSKVRFLGRNYNNACDYLLENIMGLCKSRNNDGTMFLKSIIFENGTFKYMCSK